MIEKYNNYIDYINAWIASQPRQGYGIRSQLAQHLNIQTSYMSQILAGSIKLKEEYAFLMVEFFKLDDLEADYFLNLVALERAGTTQLKNYYQSKINRQRKELKKVIRTNPDENNEEKFEKYFSSWAFAAIHLLSSLEPVDAKSLSSKYGLTVDYVQSVLDYLLEEGFLVQDGPLYRHSDKNINIPKGHKWLNQHHANWRVKAIDKSQMNEEDNLHFTSVISISEKDAEVFKNRMRDLIKEFRNNLKDSPGEIVCCYTFDFFNVF